MGGGRSREEIILHFLQLPLKNIMSVHLYDQQNNALDHQDDSLVGKFGVEQLAMEEPSVFSDYSNPLLQHVAIFKSLLDRYNQGKSVPHPLDESLLKQHKKP